MPRRRLKDELNSGRPPHKMVRGRCPRNRIRWAVDGGGCTMGDVGAIGHAKRQHPPHPGGYATAGRRGRRPLRDVAKRRYPHRGKQMRKGENLLPPLGSPERGAVAALCVVTEGLRATWVRRNNVARQPAPGGRGSPPLRYEWEGGRAEPALSIDRRRRTEDGAPYDARRNVQQQTDVVRPPTEGASRTPPPTVVAKGTFQRSHEVGGQLRYSFPHPLRHIPQRSFSSCP